VISSDSPRSTRARTPAVSWFSWRTGMLSTPSMYYSCTTSPKSLRAVPDLARLRLKGALLQSVGSKTATARP
jgi:hypothetical protein